MKISDIYLRYKIVPNLQEHQLRVAAVAKQIIDSIDLTVKEDEIIKACLLHDMANLLKFDLNSNLLSYLSPADLEQLKQTKADMLKQYGPREHQAAVAIAKEVGVSKFVQECIERIGFVKAAGNAEQPGMEIKICDYADNRVGPQGVLSLEGRFADLRQRYAHKIERGNDRPNKIFEQSLRQIERQIFEHAAIKPQDISDESIAPIVQSLKSYEI